jgi:hypothetical protein
MENHDSFNPELERVVTKNDGKRVALRGERGMFTSLKGLSIIQRLSTLEDADSNY